MYYYRRRQSTGDSDEANGQAYTNDLVMPEASITINNGVDIGWGSQPSYPRHHINYLALPTACSSAKCSLLFATGGFIGFISHPGCRKGGLVLLLFLIYFIRLLSDQLSQHFPD